MYMPTVAARFSVNVSSPDRERGCASFALFLFWATSCDAGLLVVPPVAAPIRCRSAQAGRPIGTICLLRLRGFCISVDERVAEREKRRKLNCTKRWIDSRLTMPISFSRWPGEAFLRVALGSKTFHTAQNRHRTEWECLPSPFPLCLCPSRRNIKIPTPCPPSLGTGGLVVSFALCSV
jgi:hypothetical protein